jgi:hypothetical protein
LGMCFSFFPWHASEETLFFPIKVDNTMNSKSVFFTRSWTTRGYQLECEVLVVFVRELLIMVQSICIHVIIYCYFLGSLFAIGQSRELNTSSCHNQLNSLSR